MEASALPAPTGLARTRIGVRAPLLRLRSDEQLVAIFRAGNDDAFRVIYDRYHQRLFAYARQMLPSSRQDAEDALQDVFVRAYGGLLADDRELCLRAWLYRIAHNRCIDELRRPAPPAPEVLEIVRPPLHDPIAEAEQREALHRLIQDLRRLPEQQRSALLMRELGGVSYAEISVALGVSIAAVKSLLVRARVGLASAAEARDTACAEIREDLILAHDRGVRPSGMARRHLRDCAGCTEFRGDLRGTSRQFAALLPALGPMAIVAKLLGAGGSAGGSAAASSGAASVGTGGLASAGLVAGAGHVATLLAAAVVTAGGAVAIQHQLAPAHHASHRQHQLSASAPGAPGSTTAPASPGSAVAVAGSPGSAPATGVSRAVRGAVRSAAATGRSRPSLAALAGSAETGTPPTGPGSGSSGTPPSAGSPGTPGSAGTPGAGSTVPPVGGTTSSGTPPPVGGIPGGTPGDGSTGSGTTPPTGSTGSGGTPGTPPTSPGSPPDSSPPASSGSAPTS